MPTYEEVLNLAQRLTLKDQMCLLQALTPQGVEVEGADEIVPASELADNEAAMQEYLAGRDPGISGDALKQQLFGSKLG